MTERTAQVDGSSIVASSSWMGDATKFADLDDDVSTQPALGDIHNAALRNLANKLLAKLWH